MDQVENKRKILAVDDEPRNLKILQLSLGNQWEIKSAVSGEEALAILKTFIPDVVLLDIMMPGIDGYEVCRQIRSNAELSLTKVILISGKAMIEERLKGYDVGADDYITKPFIPEELLAKVKVFIRLTDVERQLKIFNSSLEEQVEDRTRELTAAESKLINSKRMCALGEMAGGIAHEINTPLAALLLRSEFMEDCIEEGTVTNEIVAKYVTDMKKISQKIAKIIQGLRTFSRDGSSDPSEVVSLKSLLEDTLEFCQAKISNNGITLKLPEVADTLQISCRSTQLSQVLVNLLNNAYDVVVASPIKEIEIKCQDNQDTIKISVIDSGPGVPTEIANKIMQPFFTTKDVGKGTGLGLSISKGIIESHGGTLSFDRIGDRTHFNIVLPKGVEKKVAA